MGSLELEVSGLRYEAKGIAVVEANNNQVGTYQNPLNIHIITDTDWLGIAPGLMVALLVAWFTVGVQRNQIQSNISNFRHHWMTELRGSAAELIMLLRLLSNLVVKNKDFKVSERYYELCERLLQSSSRLELLLSRNGDQPDKIREIAFDVAKRVMILDYKDESHKEVLAKVTALQDLIRKELGAAWTHAKKDLGVSRRFLFMRFFK